MPRRPKVPAATGSADRSTVRAAGITITYPAAGFAEVFPEEIPYPFATDQVVGGFGCRDEDG